MVRRLMLLRALILFTVVLSACGSPPIVDLDAGQPQLPAQTTVSPAPGPFNDKVVVTLTTSAPATVFVTLDGSDPAVESAARRTGPSPLGFELKATTTLRYFSRTESGLDEPVSSAVFVRAGGVKGTISGVVVVDTVAVGHAMALSVNGTNQPINAVNAAAEIPFSLANLVAGTHRLQAIADRNDDGQLVPFLDFTSDITTIELDFADPFKASAEGVRIHLGSSARGLGTIKGTVTFSRPPAGQNLSIAAMDPSALGSGGDPSALLAQLQSGYQVFTNSTDTTYPYVITDLKPGTYAPAAILSGFGNGGIAMNFQANPLRSVTLQADETATRDFVFGGVGLTGTTTYSPSAFASDAGTATDGGTVGFAYGIVAAKTFSLSDGLQAVLMPVIFTPTGAGDSLAGGYGGSALRENVTFSLRAFPSTSAQNPLVSSLGWIVATFGGPPAHATVQTQSVDVVKDFSF